MRTFWQKMTSRKFLAMLLGVASGLAMLFGLDQGVITAVAGAVTALGSAVAYIVSEGKIDVAAVTRAAEELEKARKEIERLQAKVAELKPPEPAGETEAA